MSDRVVLSHNELRITDAEHRALREVRELFASGAVQHDHDKDYDKPNGFNMDCHLVEGSCGTTACIGGWMWTILTRDHVSTSLTANRYVRDERSVTLQSLFYPPMEEIDDMSYDDITPGAALLAIDSFLATGNPNWPHACGFDQAVEVRGDA